MDRWLGAWVRRVEWLCPLANTDAGNLGYCCLLRRPVVLKVMYLLS
jgi:hypothetical protein